MAINYVSEGERINYTPGSAVAAGDGVVVGTILGIATSPIEANVLGSLAIVGTFDIPKTGGGGITFAAGAKVYFDENNQLATSVAEGNLLCGVAVVAAVNADTTVRVRIQPQGS